jgi:hypothetical protein
MVLFRALGWALLALAVGAVVYDCLTWWSDGAFRLLALGDVWSRLDLGSLAAVQAWLERTLSGVLWTSFLLPILKIPALPTFVVVGLLCLWLGRRLGRRGTAEASFLGMSRPARRRRSRGLS